MTKSWVRVLAKTNENVASTLTFTPNETLRTSAWEAMTKVVYRVARNFYGL